MSERSSRDSRRRAVEEARQAEQRRKRRLRLAAWGGAVVVVAGTGLGLGLGLSGSGSGSGASSGGASSYGPLSSLGTLAATPAPGSLGPEKVPIPSVPALAGTSAATAGQAIDGISCNTSEQTVFHIHTHLTIFVNGQQRQVPAGIGIPDAVAQPTQAGAFVESGSCFYWLHTHAADGVIHIESPVQRTYTLILAALTTAPGNGAPIGGLKVVTESGWFAARPSGTEDIYKLYAESFRGPDHLAAIQEEARAIVTEAIGG